MKKLAIFASGSGSNAQAIYDFFKDDPFVHIDVVVSNKQEAKVLERAKEWGCERLVVDRLSFYDSNELANSLKERGVDWIILAGFLWLIPPTLLKAFPNRIVNIHPALLPKYGGKGMHGMNVHKAVHENAEEKSGITIHYINEEYDKGAPILQAKCNVKGMNPDQIAKEVLRLEHYHFPRAIKKILES